PGAGAARAAPVDPVEGVARRPDRFAGAVPAARPGGGDDGGEHAPRLTRPGVSRMPSAVSRAWYDDPFTGLFAESGPVPRRPSVPDAPVWRAARGLGGAGPLTAGGAGWDDEAAEAAGVGEAVERLTPWPLPSDAAVEACAANWPLDEPPVDPR